jgi:Ca2+-binding RTX toxin-like protein
VGQTGISNILSELNQVPAFAAVATASVDDRGRLSIEANSDTATISILTDNQLLIGGTPSKGNSPAELVDADDGETGADEHDDVKADIENLRGGTGDDVLTGSTQSNLINGNGGDDDISGGPAGSNCLLDIDILNGGAGADVFQMGALSNCGDVVDGGADRDTADYELRGSTVVVSIDGIANDGNPEGDNVKTTVEVVLGGAGDDDIKGGSSNDELHGGPGNDLLRGGTGNDTLAGGPGSDRLLGEAGDDFFDEATVADARYAIATSAFAGQDVIHGGAGANTCDFRRGDLAAATYALCFSATVANCTPAANDGVDGDDLTNCNRLILDGGNDTVLGSDADDIIEGGGGADSINGGPGNDTIFGDAGDDALFGGAGDDTLDGGPDQTLAGDGGPGTDICLAPNTDATACEL